MQALTGFLIKWADIIFITYLAVFAAGAYFWWYVDRWTTEVVLFAVSMIVMPLFYLGLFEWDLSFVIITAPQFYGLVLLAILFVWPLARRSRFVIYGLGLSFLINIAGYFWTRGIIIGDMV